VGRWIPSRSLSKPITGDSLIVEAAAVVAVGLPDIARRQHPERANLGYPNARHLASKVRVFADFLVARFTGERNGIKADDERRVC
jgi:hypothetical protein